MTRPILIAAAVAALLAAPASAQGSLRGEVAAMEVVAAKYWDDRGVPAICASVEVRLVSKLEGHASIGETPGGWQLAGDTWGWVSDCEVTLKRSWMRAMLSVRRNKRAAFAQACTVVTHELGHTLGLANWVLGPDGQVHDGHPARGVMAPDIADVTVPRACKRLAATRRP